MSRVKQASKRKRLIKAAGVPALGAVGLGLSLVGSASASLFRLRTFRNL